MDDYVRDLNSEHGTAENILCVSGDLISAFQLKYDYGNKYYPLDMYSMPDGSIIFHGAEILYKGHDREYGVVHNFFESDGKSIIFRGGDTRRGPSLPHHHILNLPNTPEDVRYRQAGVRELAERDDLYNRVQSILEESYLYESDPFRTLDELRLRCDITPEKLSKFVNELMSIKDLHPESGPFQKLYEWAEGVSTDTMFGELIRKKRKTTDSRVFAVYTERYKKMAYGLLKPGVNPEDVFEFIEPGCEYHDIHKKGRGGKTKTERRLVVKYRYPEDEYHVKRVMGDARQRMDVLNELSAGILAMPTLMMHLQLKHLYQGAYLTRRFNENGYETTFPEIVDDPNVLKVQGILPIRMVLRNLSGYDIKELGPNDFDFDPQSRTVQIEGPNNRGKSEAWRTIHLLNLLINAGYSIPAKYVESGVLPNSHFISCKGKSGHGGSELERSVNGILDDLSDVHPGDQIILDEFGDSTNSHTALKMAERLLPLLSSRGSRILVTSHHNALSSYITDELGGVLLTPDPNGEGVRRYSLVPSQDEIDFKSEETLDEIRFNNQRLGEVLPDVVRTSARRKYPDRSRYFKDDKGDITEDDEISF